MDDFKKELDTILKKYNIKVAATINFPQYRILPEEVVLALKILENHKGEYTLQYLDDTIKE